MTKPLDKLIVYMVPLIITGFYPYNVCLSDTHTRLTLCIFDIKCLTVRFLNIENRVKQLRLGHTHKIYNNKCPAYLKDNIRKVDKYHG